MQYLKPINSIEEIRDYLLLEFFLVSKRNGLSPKKALNQNGMEAPLEVPDIWKAFDLQSHSSHVNINDVLSSSPKLCNPISNKRMDKEDLCLRGDHYE